MSLPAITGRLGAPKPWQIGVGIGAVAVAVVVLPAITHVLTASDKKKTAVIQATAQQGEPWHPVAFPPPARPPPLPAPPDLAVLHLPAPPATLVANSAPHPVAERLAATQSPKDKPVDPEQVAIDSPISMSKRTGGESHAATRVSAPLHEAGPDDAASSGLGGLLKPTALPGFRATVMQHKDRLIEQGRLLACYNVTPMTSGLAGFVTALLKHDVWSADDTTNLLDKDSTAFGEITHGLVNGQELQFVLWRQITTPNPNRVRITLNSPAADGMGEAGLPGDIDHHTWRKVGGAVLLSGIDALFSGVSSGLSGMLSGRGNNNQSQGINLNLGQVSGQGSNLASQLLQSTISIPDTLHVNQAQPCSIFVAGDLDFSDAYVASRPLSVAGYPSRRPL